MLFKPSETPHGEPRTAFPLSGPVRVRTQHPALTGTRAPRTLTSSLSLCRRWLQRSRKQWPPTTHSFWTRLWKPALVLQCGSIITCTREETRQQRSEAFSSGSQEGGGSVSLQSTRTRVQEQVPNTQARHGQPSSHASEQGQQQTATFREPEGGFAGQQGPAHTGTEHAVLAEGVDAALQTPEHVGTPWPPGRLDHTRNGDLLGSADQAHHPGCVSTSPSLNPLLPGAALGPAPELPSGPSPSGLCSEDVSYRTAPSAHARVSTGWRACAPCLAGMAPRGRVPRPSPEGRCTKPTP